MKDRKWVTVNSWKSAARARSAQVSTKKYAVAHGYSYRVRVTLAAYKGSKLLETGEFTESYGYFNWYFRISKNKSVLLRWLNTKAPGFQIQKQLLYRVPLAVTKTWQYKDATYPICPRCGITIEREYVAFCSQCGQRLYWELFKIRELAILDF